MAGNDKPNLSDLKARLNIKSGSQQAVTPSAQQPQTGSMGTVQPLQPQPLTPSSPPVDPFSLSPQPQHQPQQHAPAQQPHSSFQASQPNPSLSSTGSHARHQAPPASREPAPGAHPLDGGLNDLRSSLDKSAVLEPVDEVAAKFRGSTVITPIGIVIAIFAFILGGVFAHMYATGSSKRQLFNFQIKDANEAYKALKPKVGEFDKLAALVATLDPKVIDYEKLDSMKKLDFTVDGSPFNSSRVLLGATVLSPILKYLADSSMIKSMIDDHVRNTLKDKGELDSLTTGSALQRYDFFGVVFNFSNTCENGEKANYIPGGGQLVTLQSLQPNSQGEYSARFVGSGSERPVAPKFLIPLNKNEVVMAQGAGNALERYNDRVSDIRRRITAVDYTRTMLEGLEKVAKAPSPSFLSF